ncbi:DUF2795 domain-containing protein [Actinomadura parmotrematis]|uniref:DUF2795 domain-containing protein n=1 Tax=Actinomadura parmotrematis TaxID=2864039 RepID=A0ABS7G1T1_9ACTN|nr:DUF2795 domain-containing protein [Actinomadura parmotrematis]MBW8486461.1 DUF2795 domain-containing protein [Actinomadura parmotrematis]
MADSTGKHGAPMDDRLAKATRGMTSGGHSTRAEEDREIEPVAADPTWDPAGPEDASLPSTSGQGGAPHGMSAASVEERSALARLLTGVSWPARVADLTAHVSAARASEGALSALESLPDREYANVADVAEELGYGREDRRF